MTSHIPKRPHIAALGGLFAMAAGIGIGRFIYTPILPPMIEALGLSKSAAGLIASANFFGYLCGALLATTARLPGSRRTWLLAALLTSALSTAAMGFATSLPSFLTFRFAGGLASAWVLILASALVLEHLAHAGRTGLAALHFSGVGIGITASAIAVAALLAAGHPWPTLWFGGGALSLAATLAVWPLIPNPPTPPPPPGQRAPAPPTPALRRMIAAYGLFGFGYVITATFLVAIVRTTPEIRPLEPAIWVIVGLSAAPSVAFWAWLARWRGIPAAFALASLVAAAGVLASVAWPSTPGIILAAILTGGTFMGQVALGLMRARELTTGDPSRAIALLTGSFGLGQIIGPIFAGAAYDHFGNFFVASVTAAAVLVIAAILARR